MTEAARKGKQSAQELRRLAPIHERSRSKAKDGQDTQSELENVARADAPHRLPAQAVDAQEIDEICRREIEIDVLHTQEDSEDNAA